MLDRGFGFEDIGAPYHFIEGTETEFRHDFPHVLGDEFHEINCMFGVACETLPQERVLGGNSGGASVQMTHGIIIQPKVTRGAVEIQILRL